MVEQLGTHGSKHAGLGSTSERHRVQIGLFWEAEVQEHFVSSLGTALGFQMGV